KKIYLDYQSRTSVLLVKILAYYFWKTEPLWLNTSKGFENEIKNTAAGLVIGDRTFKLAVKYPFKIDLAEEWFKFTGKSFVFACWMASLHVKKSFISNFNKALQYGIRYIDKSLALYNGFGDISTFDALNYLKNDISYSFDSEKADGMELFLKYTKALSDNTEKIC
ncbi:MAG: hypothetical protein HY738_18165, partial [Bacteroidia bacterium]|nr:hypothetical protein [Bacteroidia bacterium]